MGKPIMLSCIQPGLERRLIYFEERYGRREPKVRLLICRPPMAQIRNADKSRIARLRNVEAGFLVIKTLDRTCDVVVPHAGFRRCETDANRTTSVRKCAQ